MAKIEWMEWEGKRTKTVKAFAVDPDSLEKTGKLRALNGSIIPDTAVPARRSTPKDEFCLRVIEIRNEKARNAKESARAAKTPEPAEDEPTAEEEAPKPRRRIVRRRRDTAEAVAAE